MNADASEPARAATPTSRGTRNVNTWVRTTIAIPTTTAGGHAARQLGALGGSHRYTISTATMAISTRNGVDPISRANTDMIGMSSSVRESTALDRVAATTNTRIAIARSPTTRK